MQDDFAHSAMMFYHIAINTWPFVCKWVFLYVATYVYIELCASVCIIFMCPLYVHINMFICMYICIWTCVYAFMCICVFVYVSEFIEHFRIDNYMKTFLYSKFNVMYSKLNIDHFSYLQSRVWKGKCSWSQSFICWFLLQDLCQIYTSLLTMIRIWKTCEAVMVVLLLYTS